MMSLTTRCTRADIKDKDMGTIMRYAEREKKFFLFNIENVIDEY